MIIIEEEEEKEDKEEKEKEEAFICHYLYILQHIQNEITNDTQRVITSAILT